MTRIGDLMTPAPFSVQPNDLVGTVRDKLLDTGIHCLPVVDDDGYPVGVVTSWDLVEEYAPQEAICNAMTPKVITIGLHESASEAARIMCTNFIHHLIVVDEDDQTVGILSSLDLVSELAES